MMFEMLWEILIALYGLPTLGILMIYQWIKRQLSVLDNKKNCCFKNCKYCYKGDKHCCYRFFGRWCKRESEYMYDYKDQFTNEDVRIDMLQLQVQSYKYSLLGSVGKSGWFTIFQWRYKKKEDECGPNGSTNRV